MPRHARAEQSRRQVLDAALRLFSHRGYRATTVRDIAEEAGVSTGNVYHHFEEKEQIFRTLLDEFLAIRDSKRYPFTRVLANGNFPDNLEQLALAARDSVREFRPYIALIYVDVIEFDGTHIQKFYGGLAQRFTETLTGGGLQEIRQRLRGSVSPVSALLLASRIFFNYFTMEILFNVPQPFGKDSLQMIQEIADILRFGMVAK
ncbi:MAG TPA: TetR/AcrR family transcriptional regulator [Thermoanaerobaculia bacterium]|nr:TetR/AcrR family transcriptional regulator [Thermoanaerobaculia bacterium]